MTDKILENIKVMEQRIVEACIKSGRKREEVKLLLATKTVSAEQIKKVIEQGYQLIGENKIQEVIAKQELLQKLPIEWHFIGHLQTNKVKFVTQLVDVVQSIDRLKLASKLQRRLVYDRRESIDVYIQINTSFEASKFGIPPNKAIELIKQVSAFPRLKIKGLMTIGILSSKDDKVRDCFKLL